MRLSGVKEEDLGAIANKLVEGLRGDAFNAAMEIGVTELRTLKGIEKLMETIKTRAFPIASVEAKYLLDQGTKPGSILSRQVGESMVSYIDRRKKWWTMVTKLDKHINMSNHMLGSYLLDHSGLSRDQKLMIMTSINNVTTFDEVAQALVKQHGILRLSPDEKGKGKGKGKGKLHYHPYTSKGKGKSYYAAHYTQEEEEDEDWWIGEELEEEIEEDDEYQAFLLEEEEFYDEAEVEMHVFDQCIAAGTDNPEEIADAVQEELAAFFIRKGKGKGKGKKGGYPNKPNLSLEDRKKKLIELKKRTKCKTCNQIGHWSGDSQCPKGKGKVRTANFAVVDLSLGEEDVAKVTYAACEEPVQSPCMFSCQMCLDTDKCEGKCCKNKGHSDPHECSQAAATCFMAHRSTPIPEDDFSDAGATDPFSFVEQDLAEAMSVQGGMQDEEEMPEGHGTLMNFGQYKDQTYWEVATSYPDYIDWAKSQPRPGAFLKRYLEWYDRFFDFVNGESMYLGPEGRGSPDLTETEVASQSGSRAPASSSGSRSSMPGTKKKTARRVPPAVPLPTSCARGCKEFSRAGSNAYITRETCFVCGHVRTAARNTKVYEPGECLHEETDNRGSTKETKRVFCKLCMTYIDEVPQSEARRTESTARSVRTQASPSQVDVIDNIIDRNVEVTHAQTVASVRLFAQMVPRLFTDGVVNITLTNLIATLEDAVFNIVDQSLEPQAKAKATAKPKAKSLSSSQSQSSTTSRTAFMAQAHPMLEVQPTRKAGASPMSKLRVVDIYSSQGIWATLDEGCNATCHGEYWMRNAEAKLIANGFSCQWIKGSKSKPFVGIGDGHSKGQKAFPYSLLLRNSGITLAGVIESHELQGSEVPLLLSLSAQEKLGLIKNLRTGRCYLADYPDEEIELCRSSGNGLLVINISNFSQRGADDPWPDRIQSFVIPVECREPFIPSARNMHKKYVTQTAQIEEVNQPPEKPVIDTSKQDSSTLVQAAVTSCGCETQSPRPAVLLLGGNVPEVACAHPANARGSVGHHHNRRQETQKREASKQATKSSVIVCSLGLRNFERNPDNRLHQHELRDYVEKQLEGKFGRFRLDDYNKMFVKSILTKEQPELVRGRRVVVLDCRSIDDPDRYPHVGTYPEIFEKVIAHPKLKDIIKDMYDQIGNAMRYAHQITIVVVCTSGRHRSVAIATLLENFFRDILCYHTFVTHLCQFDWSATTCGGECDHCLHKNKDDFSRFNKSLLKGYDILTELQTDSVVQETPPRETSQGSGSQRTPATSSQQAKDKSQGSDLHAQIEALRYQRRVDRSRSPQRRSSTGKVQVHTSENRGKALIMAKSAPAKKSEKLPLRIDETRKGFYTPVAKRARSPSIPPPADVVDAHRERGRDNARNRDDSDASEDRDRDRRRRRKNTDNEAPARRRATSAPVQAPQPPEDKAKTFTGLKPGVIAEVDLQPDEDDEGTLEVPDFDADVAEEDEGDPILLKENKQALLDLQQNVEVAWCLPDFTTEDLDSFFEGRKRNFITYVRNSDKRQADPKVETDKSKLIRFNGKIDPKDTAVHFPPRELGEAKKFSFGRTSSGFWEILEDGVEPVSKVTIDSGEYEKVGIFLVPPSIFDGGACYNMVAPLAFDDDIVTMNSKQKKVFEEGMMKIKREDDFIEACVCNHSSVTVKPRLNLVMFLLLSANSLGHVVHAFDEAEKTVHVVHDYDDLKYLNNLIHESNPVLVVTDSYYYDNVPIFDSHATFINVGQVITTNSQTVTETITEWMNTNGTDFNSDGFGCLLRDVSHDMYINQMVGTAFPAEVAEERNTGITLDDVIGDDDLDRNVEAVAEAETDMLDDIPLPSLPEEEQNRRLVWSKLPLKARAAIRRLHKQFGHCPKNVLIQILKASRAPKEYLDAVASFRCESCEVNKPEPQTHKTSVPRPYVFNDCIGLDVFEIYDSVGTRYSALNMICQGTTFQLVYILKSGGGQPSSRACLDAMLNTWIIWAGYPKEVVVDRGLHNRGTFSRHLAAHGVTIKQAGLEGAEQIGRTERHGGIFKDIYKKVCKDKSLVGIEEVRMATAEICSIKNNGYRKGGFTAQQWVTGRLQRVPGSQMDEDEFADVGSLEVTAADGTSAFARISTVRESAKTTFMKMDCGSKVARAILRRSAPIPGNYQVGDLISYRRRPRAGEQGTQWSSACRVIGKEGNKTMWVLHESIPVCVPIDKVRPCTSAEALAYQYVSRHKHPIDADGATVPGQQQGFIDMRRDQGGEEEEAEVEMNQDNQQADDLDQNSSDEEEVEEVRRVSFAEPEVHEIQAEPEQPVRDIMDELIEEMEQETANRRRETLDDLPRSVRRRLDEEAGIAGSSSGISTPASTVPEPEAENSLLEAWRRSNTEGPGVDLLERRHAFVCFMTARTYRKKSDVMGRNLEYRTADENTRAGIRESRRKEWQKWMKFHAAIPIGGEELQKLVDEGHKIIPTRWVDTDKAFFKRQEGGPYVAPEYKSRLVARGDLEKQQGLRTDSPTCDLSALRLILSFASTSKLAIKSADITNAYFQGKEMDRLFLLSPPNDDHGLEGVSKGDALVCRVPIYGQQDAGRGLWLRIQKETKDLGWQQSTTFPAMFFVTEGGKVRAMLGTHVDDMLWAAMPGYDHYVDKLLEKFDVGKIEQKSFRFCGLEIEQDADYNIKVTARDNTAKIKPISYPKDANSTSSATPGEVEQLRSVIGSLSWIARQVRPDLSYRTSRLQSSVLEAKRFHLKEANKVVEHAVAHRETGLVFRHDSFNFHEAMIVTMADASWAGDTEIVNDIPQKHKSQRACLVMLCDDRLITGDVSSFHPIHYGSNLIRRLCRSTLHAETQAMQAGTEEGWKLRATLAELRGIKHDRNWEQSSSQAVRHLWLTDCRSLHDHLTSSTLGRVTDKRLSIDLAALRQDLWNYRGSEVEHLDNDCFHDKIRWIDTSCMLVDCMTKSMNPKQLIDALETSVIDLRPSAKSTELKNRKKAQRASKHGELEAEPTFES